MNLTKQVCSIEQAKRLRELGIEQKSLCYYWRATSYVPKKGFVQDKELTLEAFSEGISFTDTEHYSAFTVAELGSMIPLDIGWSTTYHAGKSSHAICKAVLDRQPFGLFENEANARAALLIHLLETGDVTVGEVNILINF